MFNKFVIHKYTIIMATLKKFEDLEVWKISIQLAREIYLLTQNEIFRSDWSLRDQIRRASVSISNNIAEGFEYNNNNQFMKFLRIAKGSCGEVRNMLVLINEIGYINQNEKEKYYVMVNCLSNRIGGLLKYLNENKRTQILSNSKTLNT